MGLHRVGHDLATEQQQQQQWEVFLFLRFLGVFLWTITSTVYRESTISSFLKCMFFFFFLLCWLEL